MTVGKRIQECRKSHNMSQEELASRLFLSRQTVSQWEKDQTMPTIDNLMRLKEVFGVSIDELLYGEKPSAEAPPKEGVTPDEQAKKSKKRLKRLLVGSYLSVLAPYAVALALIAIFYGFCVYMAPFVLLIAVPIASIVCAVRANKHGLKTTHNLVVGIIATVVIALFPIVRVWSGPGDNRDFNSMLAMSRIQRIERKIDYDLEVNAFTASVDYGGEDIACITAHPYAYFEGGVRFSDKWLKMGSDECRELMTAINRYAYAEEYYLLYNATTQEFNTLPAVGKRCKYYMLTYDVEPNRLTVIEFQYKL